MAVLCLRFGGPMQAWGSSSDLKTRHTEYEPTKGGVVGMLAAALGISRDDPEALAPLTKLRMGVRVDREGTLLRDFQTVQTKKGDLFERYFLTDAEFLCVLEGDREYLEHLDDALHNPRYTLSLGCRCCPVTLPFWLGIRDGTLEEVLRTEPLLCENATGTARIIMDTDSSDRRARLKHDLPITFNPGVDKYGAGRQYGYRYVREKRMKIGQPKEADLFDPMAAVMEANA